MLNNDEINSRLTELQTCQISLDDDPLTLGLSGINAKIAQVQRVKDRVAVLLMEAIKNRAQAQILLDERKFEYNHKLDTMLATDAEVQNQKSEALRKAAAGTKMVDTILQLHYAERDFTIADTYHKCATQMFSTLESANSNLSRQISVLQMSMQIGELNKDDLNELFNGRQIRVKS